MSEAFVVILAEETQHTEREACRFLPLLPPNLHCDLNRSKATNDQQITVWAITADIYSAGPYFESEPRHQMVYLDSSRKIPVHCI